VNDPWTIQGVLNIPLYINFQGVPATFQFADRAVLLPCRFIPVPHLSNYTKHENSSTKQYKTTHNKNMGVVT